MYNEIKVVIYMELLNDMIYDEFKNIMPEIIKNIDYEKLINLKSLQTLQKIRTVIKNDRVTGFASYIRLHICYNAKKHYHIFSAGNFRECLRIV